jgi:tRNA threonylcarbamoyladenosine biosynthesis protein TsaE
MTSIELLNSEHTRKLGAELAQRCKSSPTLILLYGELGAGKTTFVQGFIKSLGVEQAINSPTYSYVNQYESSLQIFHFDLYRIESADELEALGLWELLLDSHAIRLVEWPERAVGLEKYAHIIINLEPKDNIRTLSLRLLDI